MATPSLQKRRFGCPHLDGMGLKIVNGVDANLARDIHDNVPLFLRLGQLTPPRPRAKVALILQD
jgi:hypothetical protein